MLDRRFLVNGAFCSLTEGKFLLSAQISTGAQAGEEDDTHVPHGKPTTTLMLLLRPLRRRRDNPHSQLRIPVP
ncbi:hypothetical protein [Shinella sp.]|uniref:hypothetical protein n=1 Tax=Shinella sp. TaxID=1870904 RepID=UPI0028A7E7B9|nr:hypothetical protein [Shinella sp.]